MRRIIQSRCLALLFLVLFAGMSFAPVFGTPAQDQFIPTDLKNQISPDVDRFVSGSTDFKTNFDKIPDLVSQVQRATDPAVKAQKRKELQSLVDATRRILDGTSNSVSQISQKLRSANKLTPELDAFVGRQLAGKTAVVKFINQEGGAAALLNSSSRRFTEIKAQLDQFLAQADGQPTPRSLSGKFACGVLGLRLIIKTIKGTDTASDADQFANQCNSGAAS